MRRSSGPGFVPRIPLIVVGALRAGGSGKTSLTAELARVLAERGCRPAILVYRMGSGGKGRDASDPMEVGEGDDWRGTSDEAVLLRRMTGARVFATRNRALAWRRLHGEGYQEGGAFDIILSDDGFQDPRLEGAFRLLVTAPGERPGLFDLLPGGPFRETWGAHARADLRLEGPYPPAPGDGASGATVSPKVPAGAGARASPGGPGIPADRPGPGSVPVHRFRRRLILPPGFDRNRPWIAFCALGDNRPFLADLAREGIRPVAVVEGRNHAAPPLGLLRSRSDLHPEAGIVCTEKDFLKLTAIGRHHLDGRSDPPGRADSRVRPAGQAVFLDPETLAAVDAYRLLFRNRYLVHYPG
jgi:tetraacyldisaccharide-1-P 4'-kinase